MMRLMSLMLLMLFAGLAGTAHAQSGDWYAQLSRELQAMGLPEGRMVYGNEREAMRDFRLYGQQANRAKLREIDAPADQPFSEAIELENEQATAHYWSVVYGAKPKLDVKAGDTALLVAYIRSGGSREANAVQFRPEVKDSGKGRFAHDRGGVPPQPEWTRYYIPIQFQRDGKAGDWKIELFTGGPTQVLQIGGIALIHYGKQAKFDQLPETQIDYDYEGRSKSYTDDIPWLNAARERIEQHRKGDLVVNVVDAAGNPVPNAQVRVEQTRHAFLFGSVLSTPIASGAEDTADARKYKQTFLELFNTATNGTFKWGPWRGNWPGATKKENTLAALDWADAQGLYVHGHTPIWHQYGVMPFKQGETPPQEVRQTILDWLHELLTIPAVVEKVDSWDAINHPFGFSQVWMDYGKALNLPDGGLELHLEELQTYESLIPNTPLFVNEGGIMPRDGSQLQRYAEYIDYLIKHDAPVDGAGFMCHFGAADVTSPRELQRRVDMLLAPAKAAGKPFKLRVTEFDISVDRDHPEQAALQVDYLRDFYTFMFSQPEVDAIIAWGFWEGQMWKSSAAWYGKNWEELPPAKQYKDLVFNQWWTKDAGEADAQGRYQTRAFLGEHAVTVTANGQQSTQSVTLDSDGQTVTVRLGQ